MGTRNGTSFIVVPGDQQPYPDEATWLLESAVHLLHSPGDAAERQYGFALRLLRERTPQLADAVARWIASAQGDPMLRWSLLRVVADVADEDCLELLHQQATRQLPEPVIQPGVCESVADSENLVSIMAVSGLGGLARAGSAQAAEALLEVVAHRDNVALQPPAVAALLAAEQAAPALELRPRIERSLSSEQHHLFAMREATSEDLTIELTDEDRRRTARAFTSSKPPPVTAAAVEEGSLTMGPCRSEATNIWSSGDVEYSGTASNRSFSDWAISRFNIDEGDWDKGWGWEDRGNMTLPLYRTLSALACLVYSGRQPWNGPQVTDWAGRYADEHIDELDCACGTSPNEFARTRYNSPWDNWTRLFVPFFYNSTVAQRAGTIFHESRHAAGVPHNDDPLDSSWAYEGAWRWHVIWLAEFVNRSSASPAMKGSAVQRANLILDTRFTRHPGFRINERGEQVPKPKDKREKETKEHKDKGELQVEKGGPAIYGSRSEPPGVEPAGLGGSGMASPFIGREERPALGDWPPPLNP